MILSFDDSVAGAITGVTYNVVQFMFPAVIKIPPSYGGVLGPCALECLVLFLSI